MKNFSKLNKLPLFFLAFMLFGLFVPLIRVQPALAAEKKIKIIDRTRIFYDGKVWVDNEPYDDVHEFENDSVGECEVQPGHSKAFIVLPNSPNSGAGISIGEKDEFGDGCNNSATSTRPKIEASTWERRLWTAYRRSADEIFVPDGTKDNIGSCTPTNDSSFATINDVNTGEGTLYRRNAAHDPPNDYFEVRDNGDLNDSNKIKTDGSTGKFFIDVTCEGGVLGASTHSHDYNNVVLAFNGEAVTGESGKCIPKVYNVRGGVCPEDDPNDPTTGSGTGIDGEGDQNATCEVAWNNPLTWIMCPIFNGMADLTDWMFKSLIEPFLYVTPVNTDPNEPAFQAWSSFRVYANILLIVAMLVIVMGQALGGGLVDAYTAKKVLPKILAAAILINLSVYAINLMIDITNIIGKGIGNLIYAPFKSSMGSFDLGLGQGGLAAAAGVGGIAAGAGAITTFVAAATAGVGSVAPFIGLFMILPAAIAIMGVFATIVIRQGLILFLIISSPIAFCLYALPNGEQYFKKWWDLLFKALMMYPIIVIVFCMADVLSITVLKASGNGGTVSGGVAAIVAFVLQFLPLFLIPFAFKMAGGAVASIYGAISSTGKKGLEGVKGSEHNPYSLRNQVRKGYKQAGTRGRDSWFSQVNDPNANRWRKLRGQIAGMGNQRYDAAMLNKEEREIRDNTTATGADDMVFAAGGFMVKAGTATRTRTRSFVPELDAAGNPTGRTILEKKKRDAGDIADHDRYFNVKGQEITPEFYRKAKATGADSIPKVGQTFEYAVKKFEDDDDVDNYWEGMTQSAVDLNMNQWEMTGTHNAASYGAKPQFIDVNKSGAQVVKDTKGRTTGLSIKNVATSADAHHESLKYRNRTQMGYPISGQRDETFRTDLEWQERLQEKIKADMAATGVADQADVEHLAEIYTMTDAVANEIQTGTAVMGPDGQPIAGSKISSGGTPVSQKTIESLKKGQAFKMSDISRDGKVQLIDTTVAPAGGAVMGTSVGGPVQIGDGGAPTRSTPPVRDKTPPWYSRG